QAEEDKANTQHNQRPTGGGGDSDRRSIGRRGVPIHRSAELEIVVEPGGGAYHGTDQQAPLMCLGGQQEGENLADEAGGQRNPGQRGRGQQQDQRQRRRALRQAVERREIFATSRPAHQRQAEEGHQRHGQISGEVHGGDGGRREVAVGDAAGEREQDEPGVG